MNVCLCDRWYAVCGICGRGGSSRLEELAQLAGVDGDALRDYLRRELDLRRMWPPQERHGRS